MQTSQASDNETDQIFKKSFDFAAKYDISPITCCLFMFHFIFTAGLKMTSVEPKCFTIQKTKTSEL